jgi:hypothetical protein
LLPHDGRHACSATVHELAAVELALSHELGVQDASPPPAPATADACVSCPRLMITSRGSAAAGAAVTGIDCWRFPLRGSGDVTRSVAADRLRWGTHSLRAFTSARGRAFSPAASRQLIDNAAENISLANRPSAGRLPTLPNLPQHPSDQPMCTVGATDANTQKHRPGGLGVKGSQVQILSARPAYCLVRACLVAPRGAAHGPQHSV